MRGGTFPRVLRWVLLGLVVILFAVGIAAFIRVNSFSSNISGQGALTSELGDRGGEDGRFNLLVLGYGGRRHEGTYLTDSILIYSVSLRGGRATRLSVPRDLWVESPAGSGQFTKINSVFAVAMEDKANRRAAAESAAKTIGTALGVPIHGWLTIDFQGFRELVDALGGVEVDVERAFTARYPASDDPSVNGDWIEVKFRKGRQTMNGEMAIRYARARYAHQPAEASDFARAERQQRLVAAIKDKLLSPAGMLRGFSVASAVEDEVRTNVSASDLARMFRQDVDDRHAVVLSDANALQPGTSEDGQYILLPRGGDWAALRRFVRDSLYAE